jgi:hypothetical protein
MKYFFSSPLRSLKLLRECGAQNYLWSFAVDGKEVSKHALQSDSIIIDSGAFSLWNTGKGTIDIDEYITFCQTLPQHWTFINLDVIPETGSTKAEIERCCEASFENFQYIRKALPNVMPVYHYGEQERWLRQYEELSDYIGISPANDTAERIKRGFLGSVFRSWDKKKRYHALGYTSKEGLQLFPFYSVDSVSYKRQRIAIPSVNMNKNIFLSTSKLAYLQQERIREILRLESFITQLWKQRGITWTT